MQSPNYNLLTINWNNKSDNSSQVFQPCVCNSITTDLPTKSHGPKCIMQISCMHMDK